MKEYAPMPREVHLERGTCCFESRGEKSRCVYCPWYVPHHREMIVDPRILNALTSGETIIIYSDRMSLVPMVVLQNRVTVVYKPYINKNEQLQES